jgi:hypothetical protein
MADVSGKKIGRNALLGFCFAILIALAAFGPRWILGADQPGPSAQKPDLGPGADLHRYRIFPADDPWNADISKSAVDPNSDALIRSIGLSKGLHPDFGTVYNGAPDGIPYVVVGKDQAKVAVKFTEYPEESDAGPYPVPLDAPIEGGPKSDGDRHVIVFDRDALLLYEMWQAKPVPGGWEASNGAVFDLTKPSAQRKAGQTSADAAGLAIFPGLVRYDEMVGQKKITHALRFTIQHSRRAYVPPALHWASRSDDVNLPPMGMRVRLKASVDISKFPPEAQVILTALKKYGMIVADNGGDWFISGSPDSRWDDDALHTLSRVHGGDFEVVKMEGLVSAK